MYEFHRPARFAALASSAALVAVLAGCSSSGSGTSPRRVELEAAGVQVFEADSLLYDVRQVFATDAGDVWVLSGLEPYVYRFDASGRLTARFGRQGKGPGELLNPWSLVSPPGAPDGIGVWDIAARRIVGYDSGGRPTTVLPVPVRGGTVRGDVRDMTYGEPFRLRAAGAEMVLQLPAGSVSHTRDLYGSMLVRVGRDGMPGDTLLRFRSLVPREGVPAARSLIPIPLWTTCPNGRVALFDPHAGSVQWYQGSGMAERVRLSIERRPLTDDDIRPYLAQMLELEMRGTASRVPDPDEVVNAMLAQAREQFGKEVPPAVEMLCDPAGRIWLNTFSTSDHPLGYGREWHVWEGEHLAGIVRFPAGFRPMQITRDRAFGTWTDADGVQHPASLALPAAI